MCRVFFRGRHFQWKRINNVRGIRREKIVKKKFKKTAKFHPIIYYGYSHQHGHRTHCRLDQQHLRAHRNIDGHGRGPHEGHASRSQRNGRHRSRWLRRPRGIGLCVGHPQQVVISKFVMIRNSFFIFSIQSGSISDSARDDGIKILFLSVLNS